MEFIKKAIITGCLWLVLTHCYAAEALQSANAQPTEGGVANPVVSEQSTKAIEIKLEPEINQMADKLIKETSEVPLEKLAHKPALDQQIEVETDVLAKQAKLAEPPRPNEKPMSLKEAIFLSLRYNPAVLNNEIDRVVQKFELLAAQHEFELQYELSIEGNVTATRSDGQSSSSRNVTTTGSITKNGIYGTLYGVTMTNPVANGFYNPELSFSIVQPLLKAFGKDVTLASYYEAQEAEQHSRLNLKLTIMGVVSEIITGYRSVISQQYGVVTAQLALASDEKTLLSDKALIKAGDKAPIDILTAQSTYARDQVSLQTAINNVITNKITLLNIIGLSPDTPFSVPSDVDIEEEKIPTIEEAYEIALNNNPDFLLSMLAIQATKRALLLALDNARASLDLSLDGSTGGGSGPNSGLERLVNNRNTSMSINMRLDIPIDRYDNQQQIISAKAALEKSEIDLAFARRTLKANIINDIVSIKLQWESVKRAKESVDIQTKNLEALATKLKYGITSTFEITQQQDTLNSDRSTYISAKIEYLNSLTALYLDMGVLLDKWGIQVVY